MKAFETSTLGGKARRVETKQVGEHTLLTFEITKKRKVKGEDQFTTSHCQIWNPQDWIVSALSDGSEIIVAGENWERSYEGQDGQRKTARQFEVRQVISLDHATTAQPATTTRPEPQKVAVTKPRVESNIQPQPREADDDLPF